MVRLGAIGDVVFSSCLLPALRQAYPKAHLAWLVEPVAAPILQNNPYLDEVIVWDKAQWLHDLKKGCLGDLAKRIRAFHHALKARHFDWALDLQGLLKSHLLAYWSGAPYRIGFSSKEGGHFLLTKTLPKGGQPNQIASEYRDFGEKTGLVMAPLRFGIHISDQEYEEARKLLLDSGVSRAFVVFCPFTTRPQKHWLTKRWASLACTLQRGLGLDIILLGGPKDVSEANALHKKAKGSLKNFVGQTNLRQSMAILGLAQTVIGVDTGMTHAALALGIPTIALFGSTRPYLDRENFKLQILYNALPCSPCRRNPVCHGDYTCMRKITEEDIITALQALNDENPAH